MIRRLLPLILLLTATHAFAGTGKILIINNDSAGKGFNDPTPVTPVGGNNGTTLGQQRLNVFLAAAEKWQDQLDTNVDIRVQASFAPISECTTLGFAGPVLWKHDTDGVPLKNTWYPIALANKFANRDLEPLLDDIQVQFNADVDTATCLGDTSFYYGLDNKEGTNIDLFVVVLHELGHGLGIAGAAGAPGFRDNLPAITDVHTYDATLGQRWTQMSMEQRGASVTNTGNLAWDGDNVRNAASRFLEPPVVLDVSAPSAAAKKYELGTASFGAPVGTNAAGRVMLVTDAEGPSMNDACTAITNPSAIAGRIALIDRGNCTFVQKARNAVAAGAIGVVIVDNSRDECIPPGMAGAAPDVTIPIISITAADGDVLKAQLSANAEVEASVHRQAGRLAGTTAEGFVRLYAPCKYQAGSSVHHFDTTASPNLLMEPSINSDLLHGFDLTVYQLLDIGWTAPARSGRRFLKR